MRTPEDRIANAPFAIFKQAVGGHEKTFRATALPMREAMVWCKDATEFQDQLVKLSAVQGTDKYAELEGIIERGTDLLKAYPAIENGQRANFDELTFEQITEAIDTLFEVNDPFTQARRQQSKRLDELGTRLDMLGKSGVKVDLKDFMKPRMPSE